MSAYSTLWVSRKAAMAKLAERVFGNLSNDELRKALDYHFKDRLYNFSVGGADSDDAELERI